MTKKAPKPTNRREFVLWLRIMLEQSGAKIPDPFSYKDLRDAIESAWLQHIGGR